MTAPQPTSSSRIGRRGLVLAVLLWLLGIAIAVPRYVARRNQEAARGAARIAAAGLEATTPDPATDASPAPDLGDWAPPLLVLGAAWGSVGGLAWLWRQAEHAGASELNESAKGSGASGAVEPPSARRGQTQSGDAP